MVNNKLTDNYIKEVFRFMDRYHIGKIELNHVTLFIENNEYNIISNNEHEWYVDSTVQGLLENFKQSKYYMIELVKG